MEMEFQMIVRSSSSASRRHGIPCAASCVCLSDRVAENGNLWVDLSRFCLAKMELPGERASLDRTSRAFEKKNAMDERLRESSRSARFSGTTRICLQAPIIHITR